MGGSASKAALQPQQTGGAGAAGGGGKVLVKGSNTNITHSIDEDERTEFTRHINQVRLFVFDFPARDGVSSN
jgi:plastin-1